MIFKELAVVNYGNVKKAKIDLDYEGITFILGRNKDAGPGATNGAGKSQFWSALPEMAYGVPPTGKDSHKHKNSKLRLKLNVEGNEYSFVETFSKSGSKSFKVSKNGKDLRVRTLAHPQQKLRQFLGKTEEDFYTKVYVDAVQAHPLIVGSAAVRQEFFVRMFNLENVDALRKLLLAELSQVQKVAAKYREVKALFDEAKDNLKTTAEEREALSASIQALRAKRDDVIAKTEELQHVRDLVSFEASNKKLIDKFNKLTSVASFVEDRNTTKEKVRRHKKLRASALDWRSYAKELAAYKEDSLKINAKVEKLVGSSWKLDDLTEKSERYKLLRRESDVLASKLDDIVQVEKPTEVPKPKRDLETCNRVVSKLRDELTHSHEFESGKCPTCGSAVQARPKAEVKRELLKWGAELQTAKEHEEFRKDLNEYKKAKAERESLNERLLKVTARLVKLQPYVEALLLLEKLPSKPVAPETPKVSLSEVEDKLDALRRRLTFFDTVEPLVERIDALSKLTSSQRKRVSSYAELSTRLTELNAKLSAKETFKVQQDEAVRNLTQLKLRGKLLKKQAEDEELIKELVAAYSAKGIKKLLIQRYASLLQQQVNKFVRFVFSEDFSFEFKYDKRLEVLVHRKYGKTVKTSDVKRLSGAEKKMFTLLLVIAGYTITPAKLRSNLLVLDELEANMGPEAVKNFLRMLPVLNKIIPHIVVITPRPELHLEGARYFTAVKHRGVTTLMEGRQ